MTYHQRKGTIMTNRDFYNAVINTCDNAELVEFAKNAIAKLDTRNEKRASKPSKTAIANEPIKVAIVDLLKDGAKVASEIGASLEISTNKASALARQLVEDGKLTVKDVKVKGKGTLKSYSLAE